MSLQITDVEFAPARALDRQFGLLGWVAVTVGGVARAEGLVVRRTRKGELRVFPPERIDGSGRRHRVLDVLDPDVERAVEAHILRTLVERGDLR